jgi:hypothetical protein
LISQIHVVVREGFATTGEDGVGTRSRVKGDDTVVKIVQTSLNIVEPTMQIKPTTSTQILLPPLG